MWVRLNLTCQSPGRESRGSTAASGAGSRVTPGRRATPLRARKRTLLDESEERSLSDYSVTSSAKGDLEVAEACPDGTFVKIRNKGKKVCFRLMLVNAKRDCKFTYKQKALDIPQNSALDNQPILLNV